MSGQLSIDDLSIAPEETDTSADKREFKGHRLNSRLDEYVAIDVETTGKYVGYDKIIEVGAAKIRGGSVVDQFSSLVKPFRKISAKAVSLTGITDDMVSDAPPFDCIAAALADFIGDAVLVAHNAHFDVDMLYDAFADSSGFLLKNDFVDTLSLSRNIFKELPDHKLPTVLEYLKIHNERAHRALSDALCTAQLYEKLKPYIVGNDALPESCAFGGYDYDLILNSIRRMVGDDGSTVTLTVNKDFATIFMFKKKAFSIRLDVREPYIETDKSVCFDFVSRLHRARQLKNTARFTIASTHDEVPVIQEMMLALYNYFADRQTNYSMMACCNDFVRCSDALECLHKYDENYAGCWYRKNLEKGRIFYGKNKNI